MQLLTRAWKKLTAMPVRPVIFFLPFLFLYAAIVIVMANDELTVDEPSYLQLATNLLNGSYSPPPPDIDLWHAPGYALTLVPFLAMKMPLLVLRLLNAVWLYAAVCIFYDLLRKLVSPSNALAGALLLGCYWLAWKGLPVIMTETFVFFLFTATLWAAHNYFTTPGKALGPLLLLAFLLGYVCISKLLFSYVLLALTLISAFFALRGKPQYIKALTAVLLAWIVVIPYLVYTYSLTGRVFYVGNSGGTTLYWMSNPVKGEYGDWFNENLEPNWSVDGVQPGAEAALKRNHEQEISSIRSLTSVEKDDAFKRMALENIKAHPGAYFKNWLANICRLLFNFPYSYRKIGPGLLFNGLPHLLMIIFAIPLLLFVRKNRIQPPFFIRFLLLFVLIYFLGNTLLSAHIRMLYVVFPVIILALVWIWDQRSRKV
jgi:hypothetical protein